MLEAVDLAKEELRIPNRVIRVLYSGDIAYLGQVDPKDLKDPSGGITVYNPFVINIRPVTNKEDGDKLEAVVLDIMLPIEFAGIPLNEQLYTGFVNFLPTMVDLPSGKASYMRTENGERLAINRIPSIADRSDPKVHLYNISKVVEPCKDVQHIYKIKLTTYNELLYGTRVIEFQQTRDDDQEQPPLPGEDHGGNGGNVIELPTNRVLH